MDERFEDYIRDHRDDFDFREPDPRMWKKIEANVRVNGNFHWKLFLKRAAIVIIIFAASFVANEMFHRIGGGGFRAHQLMKDKKSDIPRLNEAEAYYTNLVNQKLDELKPLLAKCPVLNEDLKYDMSELDSTYNDLKKDLKDNMANQEVIEAIIENYRMKIAILENLQTEITPEKEECTTKIEKYAL
jgi:hypothetical protein